MPDAKENLVIEATVRDEASRALARINKELEVSDKRTSSSETRWAKLGRTLSRFAGPPIGFGAVLTLRRIAGAASEAASAAEEIQGKFDVVFGSEAGSVQSQLERFGDLVGRATSELQRYASSIQDTLVPLGLSRSEAADLSVQIAKLAVDLGSFNDRAEADVIRDLQSALVGQTETVRKYGVVINAAAVNQEALQSGLADSRSEITEADKVLARLNLILAGTVDAQGDATRTSESFANQMRRIAAETREANEAIGSGLNEILAENAGIVTDTLIPAYRQFGTVASGAFGGVAGGILESLGSLGGLLGGDSDLGGLPQSSIDRINREIGRAQGSILLGSGLNIAEEFRRVQAVIKEEQDRFVEEGIRSAEEAARFYRQKQAELIFSGVEFSTDFLARAADSERADALLGMGLFGVPLAALQPTLRDIAERGQRIIENEQRVLAEGPQREALRRLQADILSDLQIETLRLSGDDAGADQAQIRKDFDIFIADLREARSQFELIDDEAAKAFSQIEQFARGVRELRLDQAAEAGAQDFESVVQIAADRRSQLEEEAQTAADLQREFIRNEAGRGLASAFTDIALGIRDADDSLKGFLSSFGRLLLNRFFLNALTGGQAGGGIFGAFGFADGGIPGGGLGVLQKFATGGVLSPGPKIAMVNEGPFREAVIPLKQQSDGTLGVGISGGAGGGSLSITVNALDTASFLSMAAQNPEGLASVVLQAAGQSPSIRSGFGIDGVDQ